MYLRDPSENHVFAGRPEAWSDPADFSASLLANADLIGAAAPGGDAPATGKPGAQKRKAAGADAGDPPDSDDPRAKYPWFVQQQALSAQLGEIRSSAPVEPQSRSLQSTSKDPFEFAGGSGLTLTDRLLLFNVAESIAGGISRSGMSGRSSAGAADSGQREESESAGEQEGPTDIFRRGQPRLNFSPLQDSAPNYREKNARPDESGKEGEGGSAETERDSG
jgi:hypothetical protein